MRPTLSRSLCLADLARAKRLSESHLVSLGLFTVEGEGVGIPYYDAASNEVAIKARRALKARDGSFWPAGQPVIAYGLWRLEKARDARFLILVEGESDCWVLWHHGLPALGLPGAGTARTLQAEMLAGIETIYVVRETDRGGEQFVAGVTARLGQVGYDGRVFQLRCPNAKKDPAEVHALDPDGFLGRMQAAIKAATPLALGHGSSAPRTGTSSTCPMGLETTRLNTIRPEPIRWLVPEYLPLGKLVLLAGGGGHGKSTLTLHLAACLSTGRPCLGLEYTPLGPCEVLLVNCEDDFADTVVPRLLSAGADLDRIHRVDGIRRADGSPSPFSLDHYQAIEEELAARPGVRLVVIDPASAYVARAGVDDYRDSELRTLLGPLAELAARRRVTVPLVKHLVKGATTKAVQRVNGSAGYFNTVRIAHLVAPHPDDETRKLLLPAKINIGPKPATLAYQLVPLDAAE
jgi:hypothetical protein